MLVTTTTTESTSSGPSSRTPSILDSPILARVERARLRLEASGSQQLQANPLNRNANSLQPSVLDSKKEVIPWHQVWTHMKRLSHNAKVNSSNSLTTPQKTHTLSTSGKCSMIPDDTSSKTTSSSLNGNIFQQQIHYQTPKMQSLLAGRIPIASMTGPIKRGLLWQQRDRLFSRWKERYFVLTRDYLHCFKRASGSANERASDMGQFIFKVKLVDVEKVEWLNRRSYSVIGLVLGREGRVLLRCDDGLEDWFELLEECTLISKERRHALKVTQSPRSRASLAAPVSHASLQAHHFGLGGTYSSALDDWLMTHSSGGGGGGGGGSVCTSGGRHNLFSDSVPDLSTLNNENHSGMSTNHSTPQKIPYSSARNNFNLSRSSQGYTSQNNSFCNGLYGSPRRIFIDSFMKMNQPVDEELEDGEVQLRRSSRAFCNNNNNNNNNNSSSTENGNETTESDCLYRKPRAPTDLRHSVQTTDWDYLANDSGFDTPQSTTQRPSSYRDVSHNSSRHSMETSVSSSRSPCGSFRAKHLNQVNGGCSSPRYYLPERVLKIRNEEDFSSSSSSSMVKAAANIRNNNNSNNNNNNNNNSSGNNNNEQMIIRV